MSETLEATDVDTENVGEAEAPAPRITKAPEPCNCGRYTTTDENGNQVDTDCTYETTRKFGPGHDAKLKSLLIKAAVNRQPVRRVSDGVELEALEVAGEFGFRPQVQKGLDVADKKAQELADRKAEREMKKVETQRKRDEAKADRARKAEERKAKAAEAKAAAQAAKDEVAAQAPSDDVAAS
jgi:hypothetical protein